MRNFCLFIASASMATASHAASIYVFATGSNTHDAVVVSALEAEGHAVTLGQGVASFLNLNVISAFDAVYLQANHNYGFQWTPTQETAMMNYITAGGGLVTAEWVVWMAGVNPAYFPNMRAAFPVNPVSPWDSRSQVTYTKVGNDPIMGAGVPASFTTPTTSIAGVYTYFAGVKAGAVTFYEEAPNKTVVGWNYGNGRVLQFNTVNGTNQLTNLNFRRILGNSFTWVSSNPPSGPGITGTLDLADFNGIYPATGTVQYIDVATNIGAGRATFDVETDGTFSAPGPNVPGNYRALIKTSHWLRKSVNATTIANGTVSVGTVSLMNGDVDGDNEVGPNDFALLANAFGSELGQPSYRATADLDGNEEVGPSDFAILSQNFGESGD